MFKKIFFTAIVMLPNLAWSNGENIHLISVNGIAEAQIDPNMVILQLESWGKASTAKAAQDIQSNQYAKLKNVIEKFKIKKDDFKTESYSVNPDYLWDQKTQKNKITGYRASHQITVTYRKVEDAGGLIDELSSAGKNDLAGGVSVLGTSWDTDKKSVIESSVINDAVRNARSKAEELAKAAGVKIKAVHRISHSTNSFAPPMPRAEFAMKSMSQDKAESTELSSGKIKVRVEVQMEFEI